MLRIAVVDAQGGGLGKALVEKILGKIDDVHIVALGTNVMATAAMRKAGAHDAATGENAIVFNVDRVDIVVGGIGIIAANGMLGEITPVMAKAISSSQAKKVLIPFGKCSIKIPGVQNYTLNELIDMLVEEIKGIKS